MLFIGVSRDVYFRGGEVAVNFSVESPGASLSCSIKGVELIQFIISLANRTRFYCISDIITIDSILAAWIKSISWSTNNTIVKIVSINDLVIQSISIKINKDV